MTHTFTHKPAAFTLVEILIVVLVIAIGAAIVIPNIGTSANTAVVSAARVVQSDLEVARSLALTTQNPHSVVFSSDLQSYKVVMNYSGGPYASTLAVNHPVNQGQVYQVTLPALNGMSKVQVTNVTFGAGTYVTFQSTGDPVTSGSITLKGGTVQMVITVEGLTGLVTVARTQG
jgi:prepilin-type N-terminal cleavage/methylation domain-containing protein